jgi:RimJ/RimL family protein N-acetyltransferase
VNPPPGRDAIDTPRLRLRPLALDDAPFILALVNDPDWLRQIGDKGVRTLDDARRYIVDGPMAMVARHGFGLQAVERKHDARPIGICGLIKRDSLDDVDLGFALLPAYRGHGYAREAATATLAYARDVVGLRRVVAITALDNADSAKLLERIGMRFESLIPAGTDGAPLRLFATTDPSS